MKILRWWPFLVLFFLFSGCNEDTVNPARLGTITGVTLKKLDDTPIAGAEVITTPSTSVVFSDSLGNFIFEDVPEGNYSVSARAEDFAKALVNVTVTGNATTEVTLKLEKSFVVPEAPFNPSPEPGTTGQARTDTLFWQAIKPSNDSLLFDVYLYESNNTDPNLFVEDHPDTFLLFSDLRYETTYFWQVTAKTFTGGESRGDIWQFTTEAFPDNRFAFSSMLDTNFELFSSNQAGTSKAQLTFTSHNNLKPQFNRDRTLIAFASNRDLDYHIFFSRNNGTDFVKVTTVPMAGFHNSGATFTWSNDFGKFIYSHYERLYTISRDGSGLAQIATARPDRHFRDLDWTSNGNKVVVEMIGSNITDSEIYLMNDDGSDTVRLVDNLPGQMGYPTFSIDGKQVMFTRDVSGFESADGRQLDSRIFIIDIETSNIVDVSGDKPAGTNDLQPRFSPDGSKIIFMNTSNDGSSVKSVYIMNVDGSDRQLTFTNAEYPEWQ